MTLFTKSTAPSQDLNYAYAIIEPAQNTTYTNGTTNPFNLGAGENEKFERQASIIVKCSPPDTSPITLPRKSSGNFTGNSVANNTARHHQHRQPTKATSTATVQHPDHQRQHSPSAAAICMYRAIWC